MWPHFLRSVTGDSSNDISRSTLLPARYKSSLSVAVGHDRMEGLLIENPLNESSFAFPLLECFRLPHRAVFSQNADDLDDHHQEAGKKDQETTNEELKAANESPSWFCSAKRRPCRRISTGCVEYSVSVTVVLRESLTTSKCSELHGQAFIAAIRAL